MARPILAACLLTLGAAFVFPASVAAQTSDDDQAHAHFQVAASYYEQANYDSALREFLEAYRLSHRSQLFYNLSLCYQQLGDLANAIDYLDRYLHDVTEIANRASLETRLENLRARLAAQQTGAAPPPDTDEGPGETGTSGTGTGETGTGATGTGATGTGATGTGATGTGDTGATGTGDTGTGSSSSGGGESLNVGAIVAFSVAGAALVTAGVVSGLTVAEDGRVGMLPCAASRTCTDPQLQHLQTLALVSDLMWAFSLVGATAGLVLLIVNPGGGGGSSDSSPHARLRVGPGSLSIEGTF